MTSGLRFWRRLIALAVLATLLGGCGGSVDLVSGLSEMEANEVLGALLNADIPASKVSAKAGYGVQIEKSSVSMSIEVLRRLGLPRERHAKLGDVFKKEGLISSPLEERARYLYALSQELELTLSKIDGVVAARVHVVLPERLSPVDALVPSSAAVFLKYQKGFAVDSVAAPVRTLVASSIAGLAAERVAVVMVPAMRLEESVASPMTNVLFLQVAQGSVAATWAVLAITFICVAAAAAYFAWPALRGRSWRAGRSASHAGFDDDD